MKTGVLPSVSVPTFNGIMQIKGGEFIILDVCGVIDRFVKRCVPCPRCGLTLGAHKLSCFQKH